MRGLIHLLVAATLWTVCTPSSFAQPSRRYQDRGDSRYHQFGRGTLDRVRADIARAERSLHYIGPIEMRRFYRVRDGLADFQRRWERGHYDAPALDQAISGLQAIVDHSRINPRDRDFLRRDLFQLRDLQHRIERGGPRR